VAIRAGLERIEGRKPSGILKCALLKHLASFASTVPVASRARACASADCACQQRRTAETTELARLSCLIEGGLSFSGAVSGWATLLHAAKAATARRAYCAVPPHLLAWAPPSAPDRKTPSCGRLPRFSPELRSQPELAAAPCASPGEGGRVRIEPALRSLGLPNSGRRPHLLRASGLQSSCAALAPLPAKTQSSLERNAAVLAV